MTKPLLIITETAADTKWREAWNALTQEDRRRMTVPELIKAMGPLHVNHPKHRPSARIPRPSVPLPNLVETGRGPSYDLPDVHSFWGLVSAVMRVLLR